MQCIDKRESYGIIGKNEVNTYYTMNQTFENMPNDENQLHR